VFSQLIDSATYLIPSFKTLTPLFEVALDKKKFFTYHLGTDSPIGYGWEFKYFLTTTWAIRDGTPPVPLKDRHHQVRRNGKDKPCKAVQQAARYLRIPKYQPIHHLGFN
jgi:hypothetical protein